MSTMAQWEKKVLASPGAAERVAAIEDELRLAAGLTRLREEAGLTQRELAERIGVSQPRIAAIERSRNVRIDVLERIVAALGGRLEVSVVRDGTRVTLMEGGAAASARSRLSSTKKGAKRSSGVQKVRAVASGTGRKKIEARSKG